MGILDKMGKTGLSGVKVIQDSAGMQLEFLGEKGPTVFRIFPAFGAGGVELPARLSKEDGRGGQMFADGDFSPWIQAEYGVRYAGTREKFTALFRTPKGTDSDMTPFKHFFRTLRKELEEDLKRGTGRLPAAWYPWVQKGRPGDPTSPMGALALPGWLGFVQGICFENRGKVYTNKAGQPEPKFPAVLMLVRSALTSVETLLKTKNGGITMANRIEDFVIPDPVGTAAGRLAKFTYCPGQGQTFSSYSLNMDQAYPIPADWARSLAKPWDQVIRLLTEEEQVQTLCEHFEAAAVDYTLRTSRYHDLLPAEVRGAWDKLSGRTVVQASYPTQPQQSYQPNVMPTGTPSFVPAAQVVPVPTTITPVPTMPAPSAPTITFAPPSPAPVAAATSPSLQPAPMPWANNGVPPPPQVATGGTTGDTDTDNRAVSDFRSRLQAAQQQINK